LNLISIGSTAAAGQPSTTSATTTYHGPLPTRYFRLNITGIASGTTAGVVVLSTISIPSNSIGGAMAQSGTWTVQPGNTANTTPWLVDTQRIANINHGVKTVTTAGTDVVLAASTSCRRVTIQAQTDNAGFIAIGAAGVDATVDVGTGVLLAAGEVFELEIDNLADVFIDSTVNGEGVRYTYFT
jgi:hypothetical protein